MNKTKRTALQGIVLAMNAIEEELRETIFPDKQRECADILRVLAEAFSIVEGRHSDT